MNLRRKNSPMDSVLSVISSLNKIPKLVVSEKANKPGSFNGSTVKHCQS